MKRQYFKIPSHDFFERFCDDSYRYERRRIVKRTKFVYKLFGPPRSMIFSGTMTADTYYEMIRSFIYGNFLSAIFSANALIESLLGFKFIMSFGADDAVAESGLAKMASVARDRGWLSRTLYHRIDELRRMRIAYFHAHVGLNERGAMKRYLDKRGYGDEQHERDAAEALEIVYEFLREDSPGFFDSLKESKTVKKTRRAG